MNKLKTLVSAVAFVATSFVYGQTSQANFNSESEIWKPAGNLHVSEFTVSADQDGLNQIQERFDGLGSDVSYTILSSDGNEHTIEMKFTAAVQKQYLYKMLLFIGCETVKIGSQEMTLDNFNGLLVD
jgi:hypothetical protein